ncbi:hypothetical protein K491DRAFT_692906 [Lophiostoma macrostomum CBS 122681]|uniref:Uncharacterized protein n=1 Tax=Lophiostoma macrostomum CBS 122681 TaxID=1314788 RepID=A0A6A6T600_9PLEO|nr:hypothetical protein K491DRAFT_692906 [Lophiostoma macrostomum CBS 122681]
MPSQSDLQNSHQYSIFESEPTEGALKTHNYPEDEVQRDTITSRDETSFSVAVRLATCVHGHLNGPQTEPASLIIFEYEVHSREDNSVVKSLETNFKFTQTAQSGPSVVAYAPFIRRRYNFSTGDITHSQGFEATGGAGAGPGNLEASYSKQREKSHEQQYFEKVESYTGYNERQKRHDEITYRFTQNQSQKHGVTPFFRTAVLLKRTDDQPFKAYFKIDLRGGFMYNTSQGLKKVFGKSPDDPINFDPAVQPLFGEAQVDKDQLSQYAQGKELSKELAPIWGVDVHVDD